MWDEAWKHKCSRPPGTAACPICVKPHKLMMLQCSLVQPHLRCGSGSMLQPPSLTYGNGNWFWILDSAQSKMEKMHIQWPSGSQRFDNYWFCLDQNMLFPFLAFQFQRLLNHIYMLAYFHLSRVFANGGIFLLEMLEFNSVVELEWTWTYWFKAR